MEKKIIIGILFIAIIILIGSFWIGNNRSLEEFECKVNSDCEIFWTDYSKENPCSGCSWADERYICINKEKAESEMRRLEEEGMIAICSPCPQPDYSYTCNCVDNKCVKVKE